MQACKQLLKTGKVNIKFRMVKVSIIMTMMRHVSNYFGKYRGLFVAACLSVMLGLGIIVELPSWADEYLYKEVHI